MSDIDELVDPADGYDEKRPEEPIEDIVKRIYLSGEVG